ncbi:hypothetical protein JHN53_02985 [Streptomyces sp. MBT58]|nr:hypothetical protein [Streptomyces sp. MBT58]
MTMPPTSPMALTTMATVESRSCRTVLAMMAITRPARAKTIGRKMNPITPRTIAMMLKTLLLAPR